MGSGYSKMKKQQKAMQEQLSKMQEEMQAATFDGTAGNGLVKITLNGEKSLKNISINKECVDPDDVEGLEDLIVHAFNDAIEKIKDSQSSGPGLGGLGGLF